jgi:type II secretory pathway predicted ATPase ExeA
MYLEHFGLRSDPFRLDPSLDYVYVSKSHEETIAHLVYGIEQGEDFILITGGIGTGKTLALHFLLDQIVSTYKTALVNVTKVSFLELLKLILDDLEVPFEKDWDKGDLLAALKKYLHAVRKRREKVLIVIDEAQNLDTDTMEGLRLLSNLGQPGEQVLQIILAGQPGLLGLVSSPELEQLEQRIRVHYELETLSRKEVEEYLRHRMGVAGQKAALFNRDAIDRIYRFSGGVPRLVNQFANKALLSAFVDEARTVKGSHVDPEDVALHGETEQEPQAEQKPAVLKKPVLSRQAMSSLDDVDLDEIRDSRRGGATRRRESREESKGSVAGKAFAWAAVIVLIVAGGLYFTGGWTWISTYLEGSGSQTSAQPVVAAQPARQPALEPEPAAKEATTELQVSEPESAVVQDSTPVTDTAQQNLTAGAGEQATAQPVQQPVQVAAAPPEPVTEPAPQPKVLHVASFRTADQARSLINRLEVDGVDAYVKEQAANGTTWYRVYLGPFADQETANQVGQSLKDQKVVMYYRLVEAEGS